VSQPVRDHCSGWGCSISVGRDVGTHTPMGSMVFTVMAAPAQVELGINQKPITDPKAKRRATGRDPGRPTAGLHRLWDFLRPPLDRGGEPATQTTRDLGVPRATLGLRTRESLESDSENAALGTCHVDRASLVALQAEVPPVRDALRIRAGG
jgi:DNA invertase Pin-like site-specific DNA recombinase